jgi:hypothetical protein
MKFIDFLAEDASISFDTAIRTIKADCKPFLTDANGQFMYRGMPRDLSSNILNRFPQPKERPPRDSGKGFNLMFNAGVKLAFDIDEVRRKSLFGGDVLTAMDYGDVNFCFPIGKFKYMFAKDVQDSLSEQHEYYGGLARHLHMGNGSMYYLTIKTMFQEIEDTTLNKFLTDDKDPMWLEVFKAPARKVRHALKKTFEDLYIVNGSLSLGLSGGAEIMIYESSGYYTIPWSRVVGQMVGDGIKIRSQKKFNNTQVLNYMRKALA